MNEPIRDPKEVHLAEGDLEKGYGALKNDCEWWVVAGRGAFAFRFGPYNGKQCGEILKRAVEERIALTVVANCGREFDWELARDMAMKLVLEGDPGWKPPETEVHGPEKKE